MKKILILIVFCALFLAGSIDKIFGQTPSGGTSPGYLWACTFTYSENPNWTAGFVNAWNQAKELANLGTSKVVSRNINFGEILSPGSWSLGTLTIENYGDLSTATFDYNYSGAVHTNQYYNFSYITINNVDMQKLSGLFVSIANTDFDSGAYYDAGDTSAQAFWSGYAFCMEQLSYNPYVLLAPPDTMW